MKEETAKHINIDNEDRQKNTYMTKRKWGTEEELEKIEAWGNSKEGQKEEEENVERNSWR